MTGLHPRRRLLVRGTLLGFLGLAAVAGLWLVAVVPPGDSPYFPKCQWHQLTGLHCPGCGVTRALHSGLNGNLAQMLAYNLLAPVLLPVLGVWLGRSLWAWAWGREEYTRRRPYSHWRDARLPVLLTAGLILFGVLRNLPWEPFVWLAPHELAR